MQATVSFDEVKQLLKLQLDTLWSKALPLQSVAPLMLWGPPGVGKSSVIREVAKEQGIGFIDIRLSQREPVDLRGLPMPDGDQVKWLLSSEWPRDPDSKGIILFDEISAADRSLQVAAYELILDRRLGDLYTLPDGWLVCAAGNRTGDHAVSLPMSSALANRFCHLEVAANLEDWCDWALSEQISSELIAFLRFMPKHFFSLEGNPERGWPSPRSWERVGRMLNPLKNLPEALQLHFITGLVGQGVAIEFQAFCQWTRKLPAIKDLLSGQVAFERPERADQNYALAIGLAEGVLQAPEELQARYIHHFLKIGQQLSSDFAAMAFSAVIKQCSEQPEDAQPQLLTQIYTSSEFEPWMAEHGEVFARQFSGLSQMLAQMPEDTSAQAEKHQAAPGPLATWDDDLPADSGSLFSGIGDKGSVADNKDAKKQGVL